MRDTITNDVALLDSAGSLLASYDVVFCDVWGVVHNGVTPYATACEALARFRDGGGAVVLVTNSPVPAKETGDFIATHIGVPRNAWDAIITSGDLTRGFITAHDLSRIHHIGPPRDLPVFKGLDVERVTLDEAQGIICTGVVDDVRETGETYRPVLETARDRGLPLVCGNPDLVVEVGGIYYPCAGAVAVIYESLGGEVFWAGKPHEPVYAGAHRLAEERLGRAVDRRRILGIGDALRTDMAGAAGYGIDGLLIGRGIHREELMPDDDAIDANRLSELLATSTRRKPIAAMPTLAW
ncbi:TIGR01459 family HAD-type hydrolase [Leptospira interrogans]